MNKGRKLAGILCMLLGAALLAGAIWLMMENQREENEAGTEAAAVLAEFQQELGRENSALMMPTTGAKVQEGTQATGIEAEMDAGENPQAMWKDEETGGTWIDMETGDAQATPAPMATVMPEMLTMEIGKHSYIGYIEMPTLGISLPVMSEWSYPKLRIAPCRYTGSVYDDTMVILAHNYTRHFGRIRELDVGDPVQFIDADGNIYQYTVAKHETLEKRDVEAMVNSEYDLTLFTCTYGGKYRVTVRLKRTNRFA